jgi:hypothetical protein
MRKTIDSEPRDEEDQALSVFAKRRFARKHGELPPQSSIEDETLLRYVDGALSEGDREKLEARLVTDLDARDRLGILVGGLGDVGIASPALPENVLVKASRFVFHVAGGALELLRGQGATAMQPALAVRSGHVTTDVTRPSAFQIEREFHTAQGVLAARFELHAERADAAAEGLVDLVVHAGSGGQPAEGIRCKLLRDGRPIDSRELEGEGCTFAHLNAARYEVELRKGGVEVGRVLLDLRG